VAVSGNGGGLGMVDGLLGMMLRKESGSGTAPDLPANPPRSR
jgi:hypothetical protein